MNPSQPNGDSFPMKPDVFSDLKDHYTLVAKELSSQAHQAGLLKNPAGVGTEREEVYRAFLERHVPKMCDVFLGGCIFATWRATPQHRLM